VSDLSTPLSSSPPREHASLASNPRINGALTPSILDSSHHSNGLSPLPGGHGELDPNSLHESLRRASVQHFPGGSLNFERFETEHIDDCVSFIHDLISRSAQLNGVSIEEMRQGVKIMATGGGAHRFYERFGAELCVEVSREDEMECLIEGLKLLTLIPDEVYYFSDELIHSVSHPNAARAMNGKDGVYERPSPDPPRYAVTFESNPTPQLPCLLVNIGSGVSVIRVDEDGSFERVSGTSLGGGTLWGLLSLLTPATTFDGACG
jgi:type II pantothenate kinase